MVKGVILGSLRGTIWFCDRTIQFCQNGRFDLVLDGNGSHIPAMNEDHSPNESFIA